jgi:hypothetical protein
MAKLALRAALKVKNTTSAGLGWIEHYPIELLRMFLGGAHPE